MVEPLSLSFRDVYRKVSRCPNIHVFYSMKK